MVEQSINILFQVVNIHLIVTLHVFLGSCKFCTGYAEAIDHVHDLQDTLMTSAS